ncbi:hypothetical protein FEM48_Zijuj01G0221700 [Ziziphus jujuba var. spinosa]|uniref:Uncharacterized protein n=1 Tax=Ziziphus jujuba var. spinosa TaxID=714518 RepID=A0A978W3U8_ZIZJJ|nr:hypothetical protein FEM48_Zijuj01G0221700 [Ziziphus jujuba var. spinosa]
MMTNFELKVSVLKDEEAWELFSKHAGEDSVNTGRTLFEILKDCRLLEECACNGTVKMHDIVRDVAIRIAS